MLKLMKLAAFALVTLGFAAATPAVARINDVEARGRDTAPSVEALAYLDRALELLRQHHYRSAGADWPTIIASARAAAVGAKTPGDTYSAIRGAIAALGERHTRLAPPAGAQPPPSAARQAAMPVVTHEGGVGIARLPGLLGGDPKGPAGQYAAILSDGIAAHVTAGGCGWIVDLRQNGGGNMWPMLAGLSPLLGDPPFGWFIAPGGKTTPWVRTADGRPVPGARRPIDPAQPRQTAPQPIAVLLGPHTGSSGEMTAMALIGRDRVRSFGQPTAGLSTANVTFPLADGAVLVITTANAADRTGFQYEGPIAPDEKVPLESAEAAALRWLSDQGCKAAS
jgi:carboxyl-terminal processing protease